MHDYDDAIRRVELYYEDVIRQLEKRDVVARVEIEEEWGPRMAEVISVQKTPDGLYIKVR